MVSYSTLGSGQGELIDKVVEAVKIAQEQRPDLAIDGEFQFDECGKCRRKINPAVWTCQCVWPDASGIQQSRL